MKYSLKILTISLLFSFTPSLAEYPSFTNSTPRFKMSVDTGSTKSTSKPLLNSSSRNRRLNNLMQNNFFKNIFFCSKSPTKQKTAIIKNVTSLPIYNNVSILHHIYDPIKIHRHNVLEQFTHNNPATHTVYFQKYYITEISKQFLTSHNLDINKFESCEGNLLQHTIHQEFITLTDTTAHLWNERFNSPNIQKLTATITDFAIAGISFNSIGEISKAITLADAGWAMLDCIQAAGEGIIEGISSMGYTITHPVSTVQNFIHATINCGYYFGVALHEINCITKDILYGDFDTAHNKYTIWSNHFKNIAYTLSEQCKELTIRDIIKTVARSTIECYATTRAINGFSNLFKLAHNNTANIAKKINNITQKSPLLMSAEGIPIRVAQATLQQIKKIPKANDKLLQLLSQFKSQKIKVGRITCLLDKKGLKHILERHHPEYWNGTLKLTQTFFNKDTTIPEIINLIKQVIKQNKDLILKQGIVNGQVDGVIKNTIYRVGFKQGRIGQFYIPLK